MASPFRALLPDVIRLMLITVDLITDVGFAVHLHRNGVAILFYFVLLVIVVSGVAVNVLAALEIKALLKNVGEENFESLQLSWVVREETKTALVYLVLMILGLLPHVLVGLKIWIVRQNREHGNEATSSKLVPLLGQRTLGVTKELQSLVESGPMIYAKCFYVTTNAVMYRQNWPLLLGLSLNVVSLFYGLKEDLSRVEHFKNAALVVSFVNLSLRVIIIVSFALSFVPWVFFVPILCSVVAILAWGLWLYFDLPVFPSKFDVRLEAIRPTLGVPQVCVSSLVFAMFCVPDNLHNGISVLPYSICALIIAFLPDIPLELKFIIPLAGTLGQVPAKVWWKLLKIRENENDGENPRPS